MTPNRAPVHPSCHPIVKRLFEEIRTRHLMVNAVAARAGLSPSTLQRWRSGRLNATIMDLEAALNAVGLIVTAGYPNEPAPEPEASPDWRQRWTDAQIDRAAYMWNEEGKTAVRIAAELGVPEGALLSIIRRHRHLFNRRHKLKKASQGS